MDDTVLVKKRKSQQDFTDDEADVKFFQWLRPRLFFFFCSSVGDGKRYIKQNKHTYQSSYTSTFCILHDDPYAWALHETAIVLDHVGRWTARS